jgi:hypothetical protein
MFVPVFMNSAKGKLDHIYHHQTESVSIFLHIGHECPYAIKMNQLGEKAFIPQRPSKFTSQTFQEPILGQVSLDLKGQFFLKPRHPSKGKHWSN